jgi:4'-phosphopantetheinyl transferase
VQPHWDLPELAKRIFSEEDLRTFQALPGREAPAAFFRAWTRKEAYLKARGEGIADGLRQISVSLGPEETGSIKDTRDEAAARTWRWFTLPVPADYRGSLACDHVDKQLECNFVHLNKSEIIREPLPGFSQDSL